MYMYTTHTHICVHVNRLQDTKARLTLDPLSESTAAKPSSAARVETNARTTLADTCTCIYTLDEHGGSGYCNVLVEPTVH